MNELIAIAVILFGIYMLFVIASKLMKGAVNLGQKGISKSKEVANTISERIDERREEQFRNKLFGVVGEEVVRELTRRAMRNGIDPTTHNICYKCKGKGCNHCNHSGWC